VLCLWLFTVILPAIGFGSFAQQFEQYVDKAAPCLLSPVVALLLVRLRARGYAAFLTGLVGGVAFLFWFFVIFELAMALAGLALLGLGVALGYRGRLGRGWGGGGGGGGPPPPPGGGGGPPPPPHPRPTDTVWTTEP
jgi:hypothetical protein